MLSRTCAILVTSGCAILATQPAWRYVRHEETVNPVLFIANRSLEERQSNSTGPRSSLEAAPAPSKVPEKD